MTQGTVETLELITDEPSSALSTHLKLTVTVKDEINRPGQFGLSHKVEFDDAFYFVKRPPTPMRAAESKAHYAEMSNRFDAEFKKRDSFLYINSRCADSFANSRVKFSVAEPIARYNRIADGGIRIPVLLYKYEAGTDLSKLSQFKAKTAEEFLAFARGLGRVVQLIHNHGILHSFIVPRNIIARDDSGAEFVLVGFGYSTFCDSKPNSPDHHQVSESDSLYRAPECRQTTDHLGALWYPVDIFSVGAILFHFATGNQPPAEVPRDVVVLKRMIYSAVKTSNETLFNQNENVLKILDKCLRNDPEDRFSCAEELLEALDIASQATGKASPARKVEEVDSQDQRIEENRTFSIGDYKKRLGPFFLGLLENWDQKLVGDKEKLLRGHYEVYGHRDLLVTSLCRLLSVAHSGDLYRTMTLPSYWTDENLGSNGRFLTMNKHMARQGVRIQRLFLVTQDFHELPEEEQEVFEEQFRAQQDVERFRKIYPHSGTGDFQIKVKKLSNREFLNRFETDNQQVAYLKSASGHTLCLNFTSHGRVVWLNGRKMIVRKIKKVRYWTPDAHRADTLDKSINTFDRFWESGAYTLGDYIGQSPELVNLADLLQMNTGFGYKKTGSN